MAVWFCLAAIVPVLVGCEVVVIWGIVVSSSVQSSVFSSRGLCYCSFFALIVESRLNILLWFRNCWFIWGVWCWLWFWFDRPLPASTVSAIVGSRFLGILWGIDLFDCIKRWGRNGRKSTHPGCEPVWSS